MRPPISGVDKFVSPGDIGYPVFSAPWGKFGVSICSDEIHPEGYRIMMLNGAQVIAHPTNLPQGIEFSLNFINPTRAIENRIYIVAANRVGIERRTRYIGLSSIYSFEGNVLARAGPKKNELVFADADLALAGEKHVVLRPGKEEWDIVRDRRPEHYAKLVEKKS
jgi:predicted amidohydrolase